MGLFGIVRNSNNNKKNSNQRGKNGKYVNFDMSQFNQVYRSNNINSNQNYENNGGDFVVNTIENNSYGNINNGSVSSNYVGYNDVNVDTNVSTNTGNYSDGYNSESYSQNDTMVGPTGAQINRNANVVNVQAKQINGNKGMTEAYGNEDGDAIPANPIAPVQEEFVEQDYDIKNVKANLFSLFGMMMGMTLKPGTTIIKNAKKYRDTSKAFMITTWITMVSLVLCFVVRIVVGSFVRTTNAVTGFSKVQFNPAFIFQIDNYTEYLVIAFVVSGFAICVISLVYYASSFLNSKGVPMGAYVMIGNLSILPLMIGVVVLYPIVSIFAKYLAVGVIIFTFLYTLISFFIGMNQILVFNNIDRQIMYNVLNISVILMVMIISIIVLIRCDILTMPDMVV